MALPPTGSTITMSAIRNYFGAGTGTISVGTLGTYLGISVGTTIQMSATFGGQSVLDTAVSRYNEMQIKISNVLGNGSGNFGYGQTLASSLLSTGNVNPSHMQNLKLDLNDAYIHQTGTDPGLTNVNTQVDITETVYVEYETVTNIVYNNKNDIFEASQASVEAKLTNQRSTAWGGGTQPQTVFHEFSVTFSNSDQRRYFFNAGGEIRFAASLTSGSGAKYIDWNSMLTAMGTVKFNYDTTTGSSGTSPNNIGNFDLTTSYQVIWIKSGSGVYSGNDTVVYAKVDSVDSGKLIFKVEFNDSSPGNVDEPVTGTLTSTITQLRPTGIYVEVATPVYLTTANLA
jgi:hypothetical protein